MEKSYRVNWKTAENNERVDYFVTTSDGLLTASFIHICENPAGEAELFTGKLLQNGIKKIEIREVN